MANNAAEVTRGSTLKIDGVLVEGIENLRYLQSSGGALQISTHVKIKDSTRNGTQLNCEILFRGKKVNGIKTTTAEQIGANNALTASSVTAAGVLTPSKNPGLNIGDYLEPASGDTLIVSGIDRSGSAVTYNVTKDGGGSITAVTASKNYSIKRPAAKMDFSGFAVGFNVDPGGGVYRSPCSIQVTGDIDFTVGDPDL